MIRDRGSAVVEFVAVVPLVVLVGMTVLQMALLAHARSIVGAAANDGARAAAVSANSETAARAVANSVVEQALGDVPITSFRMTRSGAFSVPVITVDVVARPHLALLPDFLEVRGRGHALAEGLL